MEEILSKRTPNTKVFNKEHGIFEAVVYSSNVHYFKDGKYEEIKNNLIEKNNLLINEEKSYKTIINKDNASIRYEQDNDYLEITPIIDKVTKYSIDNNTEEYSKISFINIIDNIDLSYLITNNKVKEELIINKQIGISDLSYNINSNLQLSIKDNELLASKNEKTIFKFLVPYIEDNNHINGKVYYELNNNKLILRFDKEWINSEERKYPVIIDPTLIITDNGLDDTYIYSGDTNDTRYNRVYFNAGVEKVNNQDRINYGLLKFALPSFSTGEEIIKAELILSSYDATDTIREMTDQEAEENLIGKEIEVHKLTSDWTLSGANWNNMSNNYSSEVEAVGLVSRSYYIQQSGTVYDHVIEFSTIPMLITDLVKKWYRDEPNYGVLVKQASNAFINNMYPKFYSSNYSNTNLAPKLVISYRNQSGLEDYWDYSSQSFSDGTAFVNNYNGNLVTKFELASTLGVLPASIGITYNTNDVVLNNNTIYGKGYRLTLDETIKEVTVSSINVLEYKDGDGTIHYFYLNADDNKYYDEDGLSLSAVKENNIITITNKNGNKIRFTLNGNIYYLDKIIDTDNKEINITRNSNNYITKITDSSNEEINITYDSSTITVASPKETSHLNISNSNLSSITTINGNTVFNYDSNNIVTSITDVDGTKIEYEYYNKNPYKIKKVKEYGINNTLGQYYEISYGLKTSTITDNKGRITTNIYNYAGNLLSRNSMTPDGNIKEAYSISSVYGDEDTNGKNKIIKNTIPIKHCKNLFGITNYTSMSSKLTLSSNMSLVNEPVAFEGASAIKLVSSSASQYASYHYQISATSTKTVSFYIKTTGNAKVGFYNYSNDELLQEFDVALNINFEKIIYTSTNIDFYIKIINVTACTTYLGDIQIEEGEIPNDVNIVTNSDFSNGANEWELEAYDINTSSPVSNIFEVVNIDNYGNKALKVNMHTQNRQEISKTIDVSGSIDDLYYLSFWYKNDGVETLNEASEIDLIRNSVSVYFTPQSGEIEQCVPAYSLNCNKGIWQYFSIPFAPYDDYRNIIIVLNQGRNSGNLYLTNFSLYKSLKTKEFYYDDNGNVTETVENYDNNIFNYDQNNELISGANVRGKNFRVEYDNIKTERVLRATSSDGLSNKLSYDNNGNPTKIKVSHDYNDTFATDYYKIRSKGTNEYLNISNGELKFREDYCNNTIFKVTITNEELKISDSIHQNKYLDIINNNLVLTHNELLFNYHLNNNGSYNIYIHSEEEVPGEETIIHNKYLKRDNNHIILVEDPTDVVDNYLYEFYFEKATSLFIETNSEYTQDGRFLTSVTDSLYNKTSYLRNNTNGLLTKITDAKENEIEYTYNNKKQVTKIKQGSREVNYSYNGNNLLSQISQDNKVFSLTYNNFLNASSIAINNRTLITNTYENNNGNLLSSTYGNGNTISYTYDNFDRVNSITRSNNNVTEYYYNNNGNVSKIKENNIETIFDYDLNKRIRKYQKDGFIISYMYDKDDNLIDKKFSYETNNSEIINTFNKDCMVLSSSVDNELTNYTYDELNRLSNKSINNNISTNYEYYHIGKRTANLIKSITNGNNTYKYKYDKLYNITDIYLNNNIINHYEYDNYNELLSDTNYVDNIKYEYTYNNAGNITSKVKRDRLTNNIISTDTYSYNDNTWEDLLTIYNNESITYDTIGNPLTIGTKVLTWIDGRRLNSYIDGNLSISYKYNNDGIRTEKIINNVSTKFILEGNNIIYENRNNNLLYYYYDINGVSGIKYNNTKYYFIKNLQGDIINIVTSNNDIIVKYEYDSFGNILSVKDNNGDTISDPTNIGIVNPFRYRGYYYDNETCFYYLNNRYYNPKWGRFLNADGIICSNKDLLSQNLFIYCSNNYTNCVDISGRSIIGSIIIGGIVGAAIGGISKAIDNSINNKPIMEGVISYAIAGGIGGIAGVLAAGPIGVLAGALITSNIESVYDEAKRLIDDSKKVPNKKQCALKNNNSFTDSYKRVMSNTIQKTIEKVTINKFTKTLEIKSDTINSIIESSIEIGINYDYTQIVTYNQYNQKNNYNDFVSKSTKYLTKPEMNVISKDGYCIIEWC